MKANEVRDEQGRRRFHGAFTGGFSAGFYNTVGSAEGWAPSTFTSSRSRRADAKLQRPEDFMDEEDGLLGRHLTGAGEYTTPTVPTPGVPDVQAHAGGEKSIVGAAGLALMPAELLGSGSVSAVENVGARLLEKMGWRAGQGIGARLSAQRKRKMKESNARRQAGGATIPSNRAASPEKKQVLGPELPPHMKEGQEEDNEEAVLAMTDAGRISKLPKGALQDGEVTFAPDDFLLVRLIPHPKKDLYGIGFQPFRNAPEFQAAAHNRIKGSGHGSQDRSVYRMSDVLEDRGSTKTVTGPKIPPGGKRAHGLTGMDGFAIEDDADDVYDASGKRDDYDTVLELENEAPQNQALIYGKNDDEDADEPLKSRLIRARDGRPPLPGYRVAEKPEPRAPYWPPPKPPRFFRPLHCFLNNSSALKSTQQLKKGLNRQPITQADRAELLGERKKSVLDMMPPSAKARYEEAVRRAKEGPSKVQESTGVPGRDTVASTSGDVNFKFKVAGLHAAFEGRFTKGESQVNAQEFGLQQKPPSDSGNSLPKDSEQIKSQDESQQGSKEMKPPVRTTQVWAPSPLLCKRFNVPVPSHTTYTPRGMSLDSDKYKKGIAAFLPPPAPKPPSLQAGSSLYKAEKNSKQETPLLAGFEDHRAAAQESRGTPSLATAPVKAKDRLPQDLLQLKEEKPSVDLFASIFAEESDEESDFEFEKEEGEHETLMSGVEKILPASLKSGEPINNLPSLDPAVLKKPPYTDTSATLTARENKQKDPISVKKPSLPCPSSDDEYGKKGFHADVYDETSFHIDEYDETSTLKRGKSSEHHVRKESERHKKKRHLSSEGCDKSKRKKKKKKKHKEKKRRKNKV